MQALTRRAGAEPDLVYLYRHQLDEADIIAVNKTDLLTPAAAGSLTADLAARFPHAEVVACSAATGAGLDDLIRLWDAATPREHAAFAIDYDRYAAAEAELAWTNQSFTVTGRGPGFSPSAWTQALLAQLGADTARAQATVGRVKVRLTADGAAVKASLTHAGAAPSFDQHHNGSVAEAAVTFNARVQEPPDRLEELISTAVAAADTACNTQSGQRSGDIFRPAYPTPAHRIEVPRRADPAGLPGEDEGKTTADRMILPT
jgi:G3E family GTPase